MIQKLGLGLALLLLGTSAALADVPERSSHLNIGLVAAGVGTDYGTGLSVVTPSFGPEDEFAVRVAWNYMEFGSGSGIVSGSLSNSTYNKISVDFLWSTWIAERVRGYWQIGIGAIPGVAAMDTAALTGDGAFGLEYFPKNLQWLSFQASLGAEDATVLKFSSTSTSSSRPPYGTGVAGEFGFRFYFY